MGFEKYKGPRYQKYPYPTVRIFVSCNGQHMCTFATCWSKEAGWLQGDKLQLYYDIERQMIGLLIRKNGDSGWQSGTITLTHNGKNPRTGKTYGLKFSLRGFMSAFGVKNIKGVYRLTKQDDGMLVIDLKENLERPSHDR